MSGFLSGISQIGSTAAGLGAVSSSVSNLLSLLRPASWRGVPFGVTSSSITPGRATAVHDYPYRETTWVEDVGSARRPFTISGFLLANDVRTFAGSLDTQRNAMIAACLTPGPGVLVHPSLGSRTVSLIGGLQMAESVEAGGLIELSMEFLETVTAPLFPSAATSTANQTASACTVCGTSVAGNFASSVVSTVQSGAAVVAQGVATVTGYTNMALTYVGGAQRILSATVGLVGNFGRYNNGHVIQALPVSATVASQLAASTTARTAVLTSGNAAVASARLL